MYTYLQQVLARVVIHRTQVLVEKKWKLRVRFSPARENRLHQTKISANADKRGFSPAVVSSCRLANVSVRQRPVRQCMRPIHQRPMSVRQRLYVSSPTSKIVVISYD